MRRPVGEDATDFCKATDAKNCAAFKWVHGSDSEALQGYRDGGATYYRAFYDRDYATLDAPKNPVAVALHCDENCRGSFVIAKFDDDEHQIPITRREIAEIACERFAAGCARGRTDRIFAQEMRNVELDTISEAARASGLLR